MCHTFFSELLCYWRLALMRSDSGEKNVVCVPQPHVKLEARNIQQHKEFNSLFAPSVIAVCHLYSRELVVGIPWSVARTQLVCFLSMHYASEHTSTPSSWATASCPLDLEDSIFYGNRMFITVFIKIYHRTVSWASWIRSTRQQIHCNIILPHLHLSLPSCLLPGDFHSEILYIYIIYLC